MRRSSRRGSGQVLSSMQRNLIALVFAVLNATVLPAQTTMLLAAGGAPVVTSSVVQQALADSSNESGTCGTSGATTCVVPLTPTGSGNLLTIQCLSLNNVSCTSISAGGTFVHCSNCAAFTGAVAGFDGGYVLSSSSGVTSITVTFSGAHGDADVVITEFHKASGTWALAAGSAPTGNTITASGATSPFNGQGLTLTGSGNVIVEHGGTDAGISAVSSPWSSNFQLDSTFGILFAAAINQASSFTPPSYTSAGMSADVVVGMAFQ